MLVFTLASFDAFLLPFFSLGTISVKLAVFLIPLVAVLRGRIPVIVLPFVGLIVLSWIGKAYAYQFLAEPDISDTIWKTANYVLLASGLVFGYTQRPTLMNWTFYLALMYVGVHFLIVLTWQHSSFIVSFYGLQERIDSGLLELRSVGVVTNPNVAAMMMNMLLIFWSVSKQRGMVTITALRYEFIIFILAFLVIASTGSKSGILGYSLILLIRSWRVISSSWVIILRGFLFASIFGPGLFFLADHLAKDERFVTLKHGLDQIYVLPIRLEQELLEGERIPKLVAAIENISHSPVFGVGSDRKTKEVLNDVFYHNDYSEVAVSTGLLGLLLYLYITSVVYRIAPLLVVPFILPGATNSFLFTAQVAMIYFCFVGYFYRLDKESPKR